MNAQQQLAPNGPNQGQGQGSPVKPKHHGFDKPFHSYKLLIDPCLVKGANTKMYRIDGVVQDDPTYPPVMLRDPRNQHSLSRLWKTDSVELPIPKFKIDANYCGTPPPLQVTITNLNDNIDKTFLSDLLLKYGAFEEIQLFFHPVTKKHLGMAHILFLTRRGAKYCVDKLNNTSVMGQILNVFLDPFGNISKAKYEELTAEKKKETEPKLNIDDPPSKPIAEDPTPKLSTTGANEQSPIKNVEPPPSFNQTTTFSVETPLQLKDIGTGKMSPKMDLDTRIKLLLRGENASTLGRLLGISEFDDDGENSGKGNPLKRSKLSLNKDDIWKPESDDEDSVESSFAKKFKRNAFVPIEDEEEQISPPPSPFLTKDDNDRSLKLSNLDLDEISDDSNTLSPSHSAHFVKPVMNGDSFLIDFDPAKPPLPLEPLSQFPPPPEHPPPAVAQPYFAAMPPPYYPTVSQTDQYYQNQYAYYQNWQPENYINSYYGVQPPLPPEEKYAEVQKPELTREEILKAVEDRIFEELKDIVRRDFQRKLIEHYAFKTYETWWNSQEAQHKEVQAKERLRKLQNLTRGDLKAPVGKSDVFGLGFKATIPKLPSFRIKRSPSPKQVHQSSQKIYDSDNGSSYSEGAPRKRVRRLSLSTEESSTSSEESSSEEEDSNEIEDEDSCTSSSIAEHKVMPENKNQDTFSHIEILSEVSNSSFAENEQDLSIKHEIAEPMADTISDIKPSQETLEVHATESSVPNLLFKEIALDFEKNIVDEHNYNRPPEEETLDYLKSSKADRVLKIKTENERIPDKQIKRADDKLFPLRTEDQKRDQVTLFLKEGIDEEDKELLRLCFVMMEEDVRHGSWLNTARWVDHPVTKIDFKAKGDIRLHKSGSCRTEGYYKLSAEEKRKQKQHWFVRTSDTRTIQASNHGKSRLPYDHPITKTQHICREARSNQRRLLTEFGADNESDLLKFNQLKFRKKGLRFARSRIHDWGLFAAEPIAADEMVIEYVGQIVRESVADIREKVYEKSGVVNYLFRIDGNTVVDATKCGNLSRFINHSCNPNCYAKIITIEGVKKIVIYSKQQIALDEEITYDYKFPLEDAKIKCLCGAPNCRGTLN